MHFTGGEIIPRRVLCPWRAHLLASTLPAVARPTAACFVRCAWMIGRGLGLLRGPSSGWCVRFLSDFQISLYQRKIAWNFFRFSSLHLVMIFRVF